MLLIGDNMFWCCFIVGFRPNYTVVYTWHCPSVPSHSSVFKVLARASKPPAFDDILALLGVGCNLNRIRVLHLKKRGLLLFISAEQDIISICQCQKRRTTFNIFKENCKAIHAVLSSSRSFLVILLHQYYILFLPDSIQLRPFNGAVSGNIFNEPTPSIRG